MADELFPPGDARALRLQIEQAELAAEASQERAIRKIRNVANLRERLARAEHLESKEHPPDRLEEARIELASALGIYRVVEDVSNKDLPLPDGISINALIIRLARILDRIDRIIDGEDYIIKRERLRDETDDAYHFTPPPAEALPHG